MEETNGAIIEKNVAKKMRSGGNDKIIIISIVVGVILLAAILFGVVFYKTNMESVVKFDGGSVTKAEFTVYYKTFAPMLQYYGYPESAIGSQIANKSAIDKILLKEAKNAGVTLSDEDKKTVDDTFADKEKVASFVEQGIDVSLMKELYYNDYVISAYIEKLKSEAKAEDILAYIKTIYGEDADYTEYNTSHILFKTTDSSTGSAMTDEQKATVKEKAEGVLARVKAGEDFATLAKDFSEDGTASDGGKFKMYMDDSVYKEYSDAVKSLKAGEVYATLVQTEAGFHIIKLDSTVENGRANSDNEKEEFVNNNINNLSTSKNVKFDEAKLTKLIEQITGTKITDDTNTENDGTGTDTNTDNNTDTNNDNNTDTDTTTQQ